MDYSNSGGTKLKVTHMSQLPIEDSQPIHPTQTPQSNYAIQQSPGEPQSGLKQPRGPIGVDTTYKPLDSYPNPYGVGPPKPEIDFTQPVITAPNHDIPISPLPHQIDETLQPNYIPPYPTAKGDYIQQYEQKIIPEIEKAAQEHKQKKHRLTKWEKLMNTIQIPFLISLLYFVFQMPIFQNFLYKKIGFLPIKREDGQLNMNGLFVTSALFGLCVYAVIHFADFMSSE
jgi:hypothetical protein